MLALTIFHLVYTGIKDLPGTSVPVSVNLSMGMSAMVIAHSLNLLAGFEWDYQFNAVED